MKKLLTLIILIPCISIAQWNYGNTSKGKGVYANGKIEFREFEDFEFKLVKYKDVDIDFSINSEYFKESSGYYYVVLRVLDKNFRVLEFETVDGNYKILELKDIAKNDKYKVEDFLKIFRKDISCIVTIKNNREKRQATEFEGEKAWTKSMNKNINREKADKIDVQEY